MYSVPPPLLPNHFTIYYALLAIYCICNYASLVRQEYAQNVVGIPTREELCYLR